MYSVVLATMLAAGATTPSWHHGHRSCHACYSGYSCHNSCAFSSRHCHSGCYSGYGCYSGCSCYGGCSNYSGCGCYSSYGCSCSYSCSTVVAYGCSGCCGGVNVPSTPQVVPVPPSKAETVPTPKAKVTVTLPSDARLWIDNVECPLTSNVRSFDTPALDANQRYFYNVTMQIVRSGQTLRETQRVLVVPGRAVNVAFTGENATATAAR